jgi:hypothetical protein
MNHTLSNFHNPKTETNINTNENTENTQFEQGKFLIVIYQNQSLEIIIT